MIKRLNPKHLERLLNNKCDVVIYQEGLSEDGEPLTSLNLENQKCRFVETTKIIISSDGRKIQLVGKVILLGDIAPTIKKISGGQVIINDIEYEISTNPGESVKPLGRIVSGGELSRIMLAIKAILADRDQIETLIFDEIDTGISGRTAQKVSEKMAVIGKCHQVLCITHLPQIAAMADTHFEIEGYRNDHGDSSAGRR